MLSASQTAAGFRQPENVLLEVRGLRKWFPVHGGIFRKRVGYVKAVDGVDLYIMPGETLGLVGESGCGKSTTGRVIIRLMEPTEGQVYFAGTDVLGLGQEEMRQLRRDIQMVFQDPYSSLNPRMTVADIISEPMRIHGLTPIVSIEKRVKELLDVVGLDPHHTGRYAHEFSGGQRQRIGLARALALRPKLIICDEPVSALDVSIQSQILNLLMDLQASFGLTYLFIAHNLAAVRHMSARIAVMYLGRVVELCRTEDLFSRPLHPYTEALISAIPEPDREPRGGRIILEGDVPSPMHPPTGCHFHTRCRHRQAICSTEEPVLVQSGEEHYVACHFHRAGAKG